MADSILNPVIETIYAELFRQRMREYEEFARWLGRAEQQDRGITAAEYEALVRQRHIETAWDIQADVEAQEWVETYIDPGLRPILEHHSPDIVDTCCGCDPGPYADDNADWPCSTWRLLERLTVEAVDASA